MKTVYLPKSPKGVTSTNKATVQLGRHGRLAAASGAKSSGTAISGADAGTTPDASKCPVLRALSEAPRYKSLGVVDTLDMVFGNAFSYQARLLRGQPLAVSDQYPNGVTYVGDASLIRSIMANDNFIITSPGLDKVIGPDALLFQNGEKHSRLKELLMRAFTQDKIEQYTSQVQELATKYFEDMVTRCAAGERVLARERMHTMTFQVICQVTFGLKLTEEEVRKLLGDFQWLDVGIVTASFQMPILDLPFMPGGVAQAARERVLALLEAEIDDTLPRVEKGESMEGQGLFKELIAATGTLKGGPGSSGSTQQLTRQQLMDNMVFFLYAGFDATSSLITNMMLYLHQYPQHWQRVVAEQQAIIAQHGERITPQLLVKMQAAERVVRETLRMRVPAPQLVRQAVKDTEVEGYILPEGKLMHLAMQYVSMSDPLWEGEEGELSPSVFNPDRFLHVKGLGHQMPFGYGKHACIGQPLAMMEAKVALAVLARGYNVQVVEEPKQWRNVPVQHPTNMLPVVVTRKQGV